MFLLILTNILIDVYVIATQHAAWAFFVLGIWTCMAMVEAVEWWYGR